MSVMKIKYLTEEALDICKTNISSIFEECVLNNRSTVADLLLKKGMIREMSLDVRGISLDMSVKSPYLSDAHNAQIVYEAMQGLSDSQASDERLWAAYALVFHLNYVIWRWNPKNAEQLKQHCVYSFAPRRSLFRHAIARLWWLGRVTKDVRRDNPYELTEFTCKHTDIGPSICEQPVFTNRTIMLGAIAAMYDLEQAGVKIDKAVIQDMGRYMNLLAGTYLVDQFDQSKIYNMTQKHIQKFVEKNKNR